MKRKITQIGRFFAMAALMLGAASWASAEKAPAPKIGKIYKAVQEWDLSTPDAWAADTLKIAAGGTDWTMTQNGGRRASGGKAYNENGELLLTTGGEPLQALKGLKIENATSSSWGPTLRVKMDNGGVNMIQCNRESKIGFVESPTVGQIIEIWVNSLGASNAGRGVNPSKSTGVKPVDPDAPAVSVEGTPDVIYYFEVTDANPVIYSTNSIGVVRVRVWEKQAEPVDTLHVAYVGDAAKTYEPAYRALDNASKVEGNKVKIDYIDMATYTNDNLPKAEAFSGYDVLVLGGIGNGTASVLKTFADNIIGTLPVVTTRAFWYSSDRFAWSSQKGSNVANDANDIANYVLPETPYKHHPIFEGLVDAENFDADTIFTFNKHSNSTNPKRYMQGYPDAAMNTDAPVHTTLATSADKGDQSAGRLKSVAEFWRTSNPYVLVGIDIDLRTKGENSGPVYPNEDGDQLLVNAVNYAANAFAPFQPSNLGTCSDPQIAFEKANPQGNTDSDTMRYVVKITVDKVKDANNSVQEIDPTVMITIGSGAAKKYDFDHPDTIWESCTVKAKATALLYEDSKEVSAEFTANLRELKAPEFEAVEVEGKGYKVSFKTYGTTIDNEVTQPTIRYSLDGGAEVVYDPAKDSIISTLTAIVRAWASLMYHEKSEVSETVWNKPGETATTDPTISATNVAGLFTITITGEEGSKIYYTLDGTDPRTSSTKEEYNNAIDCEVFENPVTVKACALADGKIYSSVVEKTLTNENPITLSTPTFTIEGGSFTIASTTEGAPADSYTIYYTTNGSEPDEHNGLIYTDKVTYKGGDKFKVKAIAIGKGYKTSAVGESEEVTPTGEVTEFGIRHYYSTFGLDDPTTVLKEKINPSEPDVYTDGWFRWTKTADGNCDLDDEVRDMYLTVQEKADGITYGNSEKDDKAKARLFIFQQNDAKDGAWRHFNRWIFWKDGGNRRVIVQENYDVNGFEGATGSGIRFFQATPKATAGPVQKFKGPFAVVINIGAGENFWNNKDRSAKMDVCLSNESDTGNEMILASVSCGNGQMGTDTIRYYGDEEVCVRLTTVSDNVILFDFKVFSEGTPLAELACTGIDPEAGTTADDAKEVQRGLEKITITFNNPVTVTNGATMMVPLVDGQPTPESPDAITASIAQGGENEAVITLSKPVAAADGTKYVINLPAVAKDAADHTNDVISMYYVVKGGAAAIDEVSAAKEVVATYIYSISGAQMNTLTPGVNIVKKVYNDGTTTTEKVQVK